MAERPIDINLSSTNLKDSVPNEEFIRNYRVRLAQVLERGVVADRLQVESLPDHLYGEWVPDDQLEITRKQALGFWVDEEFAHKRALHNQGDGAARIGDTIFMVTHKVLKEEIDRHNYRKFLEVHNPKRFKEEKDFLDSNQMPVINRNATHAVGVTDIADSLRAMKNDVVPSGPNIMTIETKRD